MCAGVDNGGDGGGKVMVVRAAGAGVKEAAAREAVMAAAVAERAMAAAVRVAARR